jgi:O-acetyl-ADP-ribose deacetylase (regulator of RNase III)
MTNLSVDTQKSLEALRHFQELSQNLERGDRVLLIVRKKGNLYSLEAKKQSELGILDTICRWFHSRRFLLDNVKAVTEEVLKSPQSASVTIIEAKTVEYIQKSLSKKYHGDSKRLIPSLLMRKTLFSSVKNEEVSGQNIPKNPKADLPKEFEEKIVAKDAEEPTMFMLSKKTELHEEIEQMTTDNLREEDEFHEMDTAPQILTAPKEKYRAYSRDAVDGGHSVLVFLDANIAEKNIRDGKRCAVVNAANDTASPFGGNITGALGGISDTTLWTQRTTQAKGGVDRSLEVGECIVIDQPFTKAIGAEKLFHSLGRSYGKVTTLDEVKNDLAKVYKEIFAKMRENNLDTIVCPMISGAIFAPSNIGPSDWERLNSSFFVSEANKWLKEKSARCAILINLKKIPLGKFHEKP